MTIGGDIIFDRGPFAGMSSAVPRDASSTAPSQPSAPHQAFAAAALGHAPAEAAPPTPAHNHTLPHNSDPSSPLHEQSSNQWPGRSVVEEVPIAAERTQLLTTPEAGAVLLSHPLQTGWFSRTAVLLCSHSPTTGAYGLCVNRTAASSTASGMSAPSLSTEACEYYCNGCIITCPWISRRFCNASCIVKLTQMKVV